MQFVTHLIGWIILSSALIFLSGCEEAQANEAATPPEPVPAENYALKKEELVLKTVQPTDKVIRKKISGRVVPRHTTQIFAEVQGKILPSSVSLKPGVSFNKEDRLIQVATDEFKLSLEAQRSTLLNNLTNLLPEMKSDYPESYTRWLDYVERYRFGQTLSALPEPASEKERYFLSTNGIYPLFYTIKSLEERLQKYTITAPYAGTITRANIDLGGLVAPGQPLMTIQSRYQFELEAGMDLETATEIKIGDVLAFTSNEVAGTWRGKVVRVNNIIDPQTQNIPVFFRLTGKGLRPGMYLEGSKAVNSYKSVVVIPTSIIGRDNNVLLLKNGIITSQPIQLVTTVADSSFVKGLAPQDVLILNEFDVPMEGKKVEI